MDKKTIADIMLETAKDLELNKITIDKLKALSISPPKVKQLTHKQIKNMRKREMVSQNVMAKFLNVSSSTYQKWERGEVEPHGGNLMLLNIIYKKGLSIAF